MRILDWRPGTERWLTTRWCAAEDSLPEVGPLAGLWGRVHDGLLRRRVAGRGRPAPAVFVVSVGNLALGGTGKTPVVADLAQRLAASGVSGAVVTRGYGSRLTGPVTVGPDLDGAGDEARLLAGLLDGGSWQVVQARSRTAGVDHALASETRPRVVILEDGHQTAAVGRHLDMVILDTWRVGTGPDGDCVVPVTGPVFPFGPWRESRQGAQRAGLWLVETAAPVPPKGANGSRVLAFHRRGVRRSANGGPAYPRRPALVSAIARPERFEAEAGALLDEPPVMAVRLGDHAAYGPQVRRRLLAAIRAAGAQSIVTTAKDWVKLRADWPDDLPASVIELELVWGQNETPAEVIGGRL